MKTKNFTPLFVEIDDYCYFYKNLIATNLKNSNKILLYKHVDYKCITNIASTNATNLWLTLRHYDHEE